MITAFLATAIFISSHAYASTCAVKQTTLTTPQQFYRVSDTVFVGTISEINNYTNQQYKIQFGAEKIWKGAQTTKITLTTGSLQACGYSLVKDEKYLVFANGSPPSINLVLTKPIADAQGIVSVYNDPQFQSEESAKESLIKRLENAKDAISTMMGSHNTSGIPFNMVGVDVLNATLDVGIDSSKAILTKAEYEEKIKGLVGDLPMNVEFTQIWPTTGNTSHKQITNSSSNNHLFLIPDVKYVLRSPLQQFKSGISSREVKCNDGLQLVIKVGEGSPACVKPDTAQILVERGWAEEIVPTNSLLNLANDTGTVTMDNRTYYFETPRYSQDAYTNSPQIVFHGVTFTLFPSGFRGGLPIPCNMQGTTQYYWADANFTDAVHELLHMQVDSPPCDTNPIPSMFSNHTNPQAGLAFYDNKMKLLVSTDNSDLSKSPISSKERIRVIPEYPITTGINKNGTITDSETIEIIFDNFKQNLPLVVQIFDPQGGVYKTDNIPPSHIQPDGFYKYQIYIKGNGSAMGKYTVSVTHGNATASMSTYLSSAVP